LMPTVRRCIGVRLSPCERFNVELQLLGHYASTRSI
jgi:hypothetical protein